MISFRNRQKKPKVKSLENMTIIQLKEMAKKDQLEFKSKITKLELINLIEKKRLM